MRQLTGLRRGDAERKDTEQQEEEVTQKDKESKQEEELGYTDVVMVEGAHNDRRYNFLYKAPAFGSNKIMSFNQKTKEGQPFRRQARIVKGHEQWLEVRIYSNQKRILQGYVRREIVSYMLEDVVVEEHHITGEKTVVQVQELFLRDTPGGEPIETLTYNDEVYVIDVEDDWAKVEHEGREGYVNVHYLHSGTPMPGTGAKLYMLKDTSEETLEDVCQRHYKGDWRYFAHLLINPHYSSG